MTILHFGNKTVSRLSSGVLVFLLSGMTFIGCGSPPAPKIKQVVISTSNGPVSTRTYWYTDDDELSRVVISKQGGDRVEQLDFSHHDGKINGLQWNEKVHRDGGDDSTDSVTMVGTYSKENLTGFHLSFPEVPEFFFDADVGYNSEGFIKDIAISTLSFWDASPVQATVDFEYTSDSLFESIVLGSGEDPTTWNFEYNSEDLLSAIEETDWAGTDKHTFTYNDDGQLERSWSGTVERTTIDYHDGQLSRSARNSVECDYTYNDDDLVKEIECGGRTFKITYYEGGSVSGWIPRLPGNNLLGTEHNLFFSLDGKPLAPEDFAEPSTVFSLLVPPLSW